MLKYNILTGNKLGEFNKIRDIVKFNEDELLISDHRNHRIQLLNINLEPKMSIEKNNNLPLILPGNICVLEENSNGTLIAYGTVKYQQQISIINIKNTGKLEYINTFVFEDIENFGPGGIIRLPNEDKNKILLLTTSFSGELIMLEYDKITNNFNNNKSFNINKKGCIDIALWHNHIFVLCCEGLKGVGTSEICEFIISDDYNKINLINTITGIDNKKFSFTHSAGSIDAFENNICIADTGNNRVIIINRVDGLDICIKNIDLHFPTAVCLFSENILYISTFRGIGKDNIPNSDNLYLINLESIEKINKVVNNKKYSNIFESKLIKNIFNPALFNYLLPESEYLKIDIVHDLMYKIFMDVPIHIGKRIESYKLKIILEKW